MKIKNHNIAVLLAFTVLFLWTCLIIYGILTYGWPDANTPGDYGFLAGVFHGMIGIISFVGTWFSDDITIYQHNNNGVWYDLGYLWAISSTRLFRKS